VNISNNALNYIKPCKAVFMFFYEVMISLKRNQIPKLVLYLHAAVDARFLLKLL